MTSVGTIQSEIANVMGILASLTSDNPAYAQYLTALQGLQLELYQAQNSITQPGLGVDSSLAQDPGGNSAANPDTSGETSAAQDQTFDTSQGLS